MSAFVTPFSLRLSSRRPSRQSPCCCAPRPSPEPFDDSALIDDTTSAHYLQALLSSLSPHASDSVPPPSPTTTPSTSSSPVPPANPVPPVSHAPSQYFADAKSARRPPRASQPPPPPIDIADQFPAMRNGLPDSGPADYLDELLPLLAEDERRAAARRDLQGEEKQFYEEVTLACDLFASMHRSSDKLDNLRPFALREKREVDCATCGGKGMVRCAYCKGDGFVDLGENGEKFEAVFENNVLTMPKKVMGSTYHCPLCGGLTEERCEQCFGTGKESDGDRVSFEAKEAHSGVATEEFDLDAFLKAEEGRVEVGLDGLIIVRAKRAGRSGRKPKKSKVEAKQKEEEQGGERVKKRRGRPPKTKSTKVEMQPRKKLDLTRAAPSPKVAEGSGSTGRRFVIPTDGRWRESTDFVNTTSYKVGRTLRSEETKLDDDEQEFTAEFNERMSKRK